MKVKIELEDLLEMVYWARRYCDGRSSYAPSSFNNRYDSLNYQTLGHLRIHDRNIDKTLTQEGKFFPYAQDGMFEDHGIDATPKTFGQKEGDLLAT